MCGIVSYIGHQPARPILINGLKRLEYRGYDSAGIALLEDDQSIIYKKSGQVSELESILQPTQESLSIGIGHTRWATHGKATDNNSHPHKSHSGRIVLVHNGIIENYLELKATLAQHNIHCQTETDTEVLANYLDLRLQQLGGTLAEHISQIISEVVGTYGLVIYDTQMPNELIATRLESPLVLGIGEKELFLGSDATPIVEHTRKVLYLENRDIIKLSRLGFEFIKQTEEAKIEEVSMDISEIDKGDYEDYMLKEIEEQKVSIFNTFRGRLSPDNQWIKLGGLREFEHKLRDCHAINIVACGTSWHAGLVAKQMIETFVHLPVHVHYGSEFRYNRLLLNSNDVLIAISQSGETADTLGAVRLAKEKDVTVLGICNVVGSSLARETNGGIFTHAGAEISVASTKAFTAQVTVIAMLAAHLAHIRQDNLMADGQAALNALPNQIDQVIQQKESIKQIASIFDQWNSCLFLGRGLDFPVALEGALKLKEISYIHAEGYPAGEMKHGPIALIEKGMPIVVVASPSETYSKTIGAIEELKARDANIIAIVSESDTQIEKLTDNIIRVPNTQSALVNPILYSVPLQLLAYYAAKSRGLNVDKPRNLAKSVTVE